MDKSKLPPREYKILTNPKQQFIPPKKPSLTVEEQKKLEEYQKLREEQLGSGLVIIANSIENQRIE